MNNHAFCFKVEGLNLIKEESRLKDIFVKLNTKNQELLLNSPTLYLSSDNGKIIKYIFEKLSENFNEHISISFTEYNSSFNQLGTVIVPFPENEQIYDIISIHSENEYIFKEEILNINNTNYLDNILNPLICKCCYKKTPQEISFCIYCGYETGKEEILQNYCLKINKLEYDEKIKLAKYFSEISNIDYSNILNTLGKLPVVVEFTAYKNVFEKIVDYLIKNNISYNLIELSIQKVLSMMLSSLKLGKIESEFYYINKNTSRIIKETIKNINSYEIKDYINYCLYEAYQIIEHIRNSEKNVFNLLKDTEKEINMILEKFIYLAKKSDKLKIYLSENNYDKLNKEIETLEKDYQLIGNPTLKKISYDTLILKKNELEELAKIQESYQISIHQIMSVNSLLKSIRTKINYINSYDIQENKGDFSELNVIKSNLISKIKAIDETLRI